MSISSKATGLRPGVCTSTTRPTAPYTGQIIYETDTGYLRVWDGAAWDYLSQKQDYTAGLTTGKILQVVSSTYSTLVSNTTSTYADTGLSATITPNSASNKIFVIVSQVVGKTNENSENRVQVNLLRGSTDLMNSGDLLAYTSTAIFNIVSLSLTYLDSPSTTSATTYKTQFKNPNNTATARAQYGGGTSTITLMEVAV